MSVATGCVDEAKTLGGRYPEKCGERLVALGVHRHLPEVDEEWMRLVCQAEQVDWGSAV